LCFCFVVEKYTIRIQCVGEKDLILFQILTQTISTFEENISKGKSVQKEWREQKEIINDYFIQIRQLVAQRWPPGVPM